MADFSEDHVGKRVVAQSGEAIGAVEEVRDGDLYVSVDVADTSDALDELGWTGPVDQDLHRLQDQYVSNVTDTTIRLRV